MGKKSFVEITFPTFEKNVVGNPDSVGTNVYVRSKEIESWAFMHSGHRLYRYAMQSFDSVLPAQLTECRLFYSLCKA